MTEMRTQSHIYLSTACHHAAEKGSEELHDYCQSHVGHGGAKNPASCKFCAAPCVCWCHQVQP